MLSPRVGKSSLHGIAGLNKNQAINTQPSEIREIKGRDGSTPEANARIVSLSYDIGPLRRLRSGGNKVILRNGFACLVRKHEVPLIRRKEKAHGRCCMMDAWFWKLLCSLARAA